MWRKVTAGLLKEDQEAATREKTKLENDQRARNKEMKEKDIEWKPKYFKLGEDKVWHYIHSNLAPYDPKEEKEREFPEFVITTKPLSDEEKAKASAAAAAPTTGVILGVSSDSEEGDPSEGS
eukprot:TRINITY_DN24344_c0_g1_i4.p1 TRINITY_DN24344_c0_g1~~TRINITY_DN24344_c0_g1_i4.p1  ORF type:complete len:122 (+),score=25.41 TRINITY_DN24344_c0_g1_i4:245-610(+)